MVLIKAFKLNVGQKILLNPKFLVSGNNLISNKIKKGKIIYRYPGEIVKVLDGGYYEIKIGINISKLNNKVHQELLKVCNENVWNNLCNNIETDLIESPIISESSNISENSYQSDSSSNLDI